MNRITLTAAPFRRSLVAAGAAALALHAQAAAPTAADLQQVKAYGNVSVAQDSAGSWGPWEEFEAPAAGPTQPIGIGRAAEDPYRPLPVVDGSTPTTPETPTIALVGWGAFLDNIEGPQTCASVDCHPLQITGIGQLPEGATLPSSIDLALTALSTGTLLYTQTGALGQSGNSYQRSSTTELLTIVADPATATPGDPLALQAAFVRISLNQYLAGNTETPIASQDVYAVLGVATSASDMATLSNLNTIVSYAGRDQYGTDNVRMIVNFGNGQWHGTWNGGVDGPVQATTSASGATVLTGNVGFWAQGKVSGSNFQSESVSALDGTINQSASSVKGSFYGLQAAAAGGVADIVKTKAGSYTAGRFVSPFLTVKDRVLSQNPQ